MISTARPLARTVNRSVRRIELEGRGRRRHQVGRGGQYPSRPVRRRGRHPDRPVGRFDHHDSRHRARAARDARSPASRRDIGASSHRADISPASSAVSGRRCIAPLDTRVRLDFGSGRERPKPRSESACRCSRISPSCRSPESATVRILIDELDLQRQHQFMVEAERRHPARHEHLRHRPMRCHRRDVL